MTPRLALALAAALGCALGCGDELEPVADPGLPDAGPPMDAEVPDTGPEDLGPPDIGSDDAGPPPDIGVKFSNASCAPCGGGAPCPTGGACLTAGEEQFCSDRCDDDLDGCIPGFTCLNLAREGNPPAYFCVPPGATCRGGVGYGTPCYDDTRGCVAGLDHCEADLFAPGYCTSTCTTDQDCPVGYACGPGDDGAQVCLSTEKTSAEACAVGLGIAACATHHDCAWAEGDRCVRSTPGLPGICAAPCEGGCGAGTTCLRTAEGPRCLPEDCRCHGWELGENARDLLGEALAAHGFGRCDTVHTLADLAPNPPDILYDPYRLDFFERAAHEPLRAPELAHALIGDLEAPSGAAPARAARMVEALALRLDRPVQTVEAGPLDPNEPLVEAIAAFVTLGGGTPDREAVRADAADLDPDLRAALARVIEGMTRAAAARQAALPGNIASDIFRLGPSFVVFPASGLGLDPARPEVETLLNEQLPYGQLFGGGVDLLNALAEADLPRFAGTPTRTELAPATLLLSVPTPFGQIVVGSAEPDEYLSNQEGLEGDVALLVDLGGDDLYRVQAGGNRSADNPVSVLVDLGGADRYFYREVRNIRDGTRLPSDDGGRYAPRGAPDRDNGPFSLSDRARWGGGRAGTAVHWDVGTGADHYRSHRMSEGSGIFGTGVLIDEGGDDVQELEAMGQGAGAFGIGLLLDLGGDDVRRAYYETQGFGYARGAGLLFDDAGDDSYLMNVGDPEFGGDPLYLSAQRPGRANSSLGQGFGFGRRADFSDRRFFSGGIGLLLDQAGNDRYEASIFAQGGGFWFGTGVLADREGNDTYDALWYAMGTGAHYALGLLLEGGGNDVYGGAFPRVNVTVAGAHDYTTAFLIDDAGDDIYNGSRISIGAGNVNGLGFFVDNGGDDQYDLRRDYGLGGAGNLENDAPGSARRRVKNLGVFVDAGGRDLYSLDGMPFDGRADGRVWTSTQSSDPGVAASEFGVGIDGEGASTLLAFP